MQDPREGDSGTRDPIGSHDESRVLRFGHWSLTTSACQGEGNHPLAFTDVLVVRNDAPPALVAVARFGKYLTAVPTYTWMHNAEEAPKSLRIPRYLSPATRSAYRTSPMKNDPLMQEIYAVMKRAHIFPQSGLLDTRKAMRDAILAAIKRL